VRRPARLAYVVARHTIRPLGVKGSSVRFNEHGVVRDNTANGIGTGKARGREHVGQLQHVPVLHGPLRVIKGSDMVLTVPGTSSIVDSYESIIYTVDQVHPSGGERG
jgi:hypothetical protein